MKKIILISIFLELLAFLYPGNYIICTSFAEAVTQNDSLDNRNEIINDQKENLNISDFIKEAEKYTKESMPGINLNDLLSTAISGDIDNVKLMRLFWSLLRKRNIKFSWSFRQYNCNCGYPWYFKKHK